MERSQARIISRSAKQAKWSAWRNPGEAGMIRLIYDVMVDVTELYSALKESEIHIRAIYTIENVPTATIKDENGIEIADPDSLITQTIICVDDAIEPKIKDIIDNIVKSVNQMPSTKTTIKPAETIVDEQRKLE